MYVRRTKLYVHINFDLQGKIQNTRLIHRKIYVNQLCIY